MRLYIFKSDTNTELRAFAGDPAGSKLPEQFRPWHVIGAVGPESAPPHDLSRPAIERAIDANGFQLWRLKAKAAS
ncbi:MAG TPA: hypothetical protein VIY51_01550 [Xanthobacteraceae bacterium]